MEAEARFFIFPFLYLIHEGEEILNFKQLKKASLSFLSEKNQKKLKELSYKQFIFAIIFETFLLSIIWFVSRYTSTSLWFSITIIFCIHFFIHILQFFYYRGGIFGLKTSIIFLPISIFFILKTLPYIKGEDLLKDMIISLLLMILFYFFLIKNFKFY